MSAKENLTSCLQRSVYMRPQDLLDYGPRHCAPVAQLDRATASGAVGHRFEPCRAHQSPSQHCGLPTSDFRLQTSDFRLRTFLAYRVTLSRSTPFDFLSDAHRSPASSNRDGAVSIVNAVRSNPASISCQPSGVDTPAYALALAL